MQNKLTVAIVLAVLTVAGVAYAQASRGGACFTTEQACGSHVNGGEMMCGVQQCAIAGRMIVVDMWML